MYIIYKDTRSTQFGFYTLIIPHVYRLPHLFLYQILKILVTLIIFFYMFGKSTLAYVYLSKVNVVPTP